jgi:hypothetical protein
MPSDRNIWTEPARTRTIERRTAVDQSSDERLLELLASEQREMSDKATIEILDRGEQMLSPLLMLRGNRTPFSGSLLGSKESSTATVVPLPGFELSEHAMDKVVTIEVAALYLISAIYHGKLDFAQNALLADLDLPVVERTADNRDEYVQRAWASTIAWVERCRTAGLDALRAEGDTPLEKAHLCWW